MLLPDLASRQKFIAFLRERDIHSVFHYLPLHLSNMGIRFGGKVGDYPITESVSDRLVRLPFSYGLSSSEQEEVIDAILKFRI